MSTFRLAPLERTARLITAAFVLAVAAAGGAVVVTGDAEQSSAGATIAVVVLLLAWGFAPARVRLGEDGFRIQRRLFGSRRFTVMGPAALRPWTFDPRAVRKAGSGGIFGWYGAFRQRDDDGLLLAYVTERSELVVVPTEQGTVAVSPADPEALEAALSAASTPARGRGEEGDARER